MLADYQSKLQALEAALIQVHVKHLVTLALLVGGLILLALFWLAIVKLAIPIWCASLPLPVFGLTLRRHLANRRSRLRLSRLSRFYRAGIDRFTGAWPGKGSGGEEFGGRGHLYESDLNILGTGSLFELICTARTEVGQRRLAGYFLDLPDRAETVARQEAVKELRPLAKLREEICLLGQYSFQDCEWTPFREWMESPAVSAPRPLAWILAAGSCVLALSVLIAWAAPPGAGIWTLLLPYLVPLALVETIIGFRLRKRVRPLLEDLRKIGPEIGVLREGLELLGRQQFESAKLKGLVEGVLGQRAARAVRRLELLIRAVDQCGKEWFDGPSRLLVVRTQLALAIERWKARHGKDLRIWLDAWAEFEALSALGCYAHEHPNDVFPELLEGAVEFEAAGLGHPLLPENACVRNDVHLNEALKFYLISGSNMAGKSTLLRAIGVNAVLACAGAPVRAHRARLSSFAVCASISTADSLLEGKSGFQAEVERLRETLRASSGPKPVLFLIDEIFSGTNSRDRKTAAEAVIRTLIRSGAVGALSTHDLTLTEIAEAPELHGRNVHMESQDSGDPFAFDYKLKPGVTRMSNALAIARLAGVPL
jgi:hypothetical protein